MKRRARRAVIHVAALLAVVVVVLVVASWGTVGDHVEAWHFQLTRETETVSDDPGLPLTGTAVDLLQVIADLSGTPAIFDANHRQGPRHVPFRIAAYTTAAQALTSLKKMGYRILDQRFPQRTYVLMCDK